MLLKFFTFGILLKQCESVIYSLNATEYNRMPALYHLDDFDTCMQEPAGVYCVVDAELRARGRSDLMMMIKGYSDHKLKHFNHTQIHRGVCVTKTCKQFLLNNTEDLTETLGACLNDSMWRGYELQARVIDIQYCQRPDDVIPIDASDIIVAVIYLVIILLNVVGSLYDVLRCQDDAKSGNVYLLAFSLRRNWRKLLAPIGGGPDKRIERLKLFYGLRTMTMICVFFSHTVLIISYSYVDNPIYIEKAYEDPLKQILFNGSLVTHTFFVMSSFLLAYNYCVYLERHKNSWWLLPRGILLRWLRLTPAYGAVLGWVCTWGRRAGGGALWPLVVAREAAACRRYWWLHLLFLNNYVYDDAMCAPQTWYLAADMQLFCIGLLVCLVARTPRRQQVVLGSMFVLSLVIVAAHTYFQDLDPVVLQSPEASYRELYAHDDTFRLLYIRGHTNLSTYTLGLAGGFLTYRWQNDGKDAKWLRRYVCLYWLLVPLALVVILSGGLFYSDEANTSTLLRVSYATLYKPLFQLMVVMFIIGVVFKIESVYRGVVEWGGWAGAGRAAFGAFLLHTALQRAHVAAQPAPAHLADYYVVIILSATIFLSFVCGAILWLLVEAPAAALVKAATEPKKKTEDSQL